MSEAGSAASESAAVRRSRLGVAGRATLFILAIVVAVFAACSTAIYLVQAAALRDNVSLTMTNLSAATAQSAGNWLRGKLDLTQMMAQEIAVTGAGPEANRVLGTPVALDDFVMNFFGRPDGFYTRMPKGPVKAGYDPRTRPWYQGAEATKGLVLTDPYLGSSNQKLTITGAAPVLDETGAFLGVVGSDFDSDALARMLRTVAAGGNGYAYLVSGAGKILIHPRVELMGKSLADLLSGAPPRIAAKVAETREGDRATLTAFARLPGLPPSAEWYIALSLDRTAAFAPVKRLAFMLGAATLVALVVLGLAVAGLMTISVARPLDRLGGALLRMSQGELDARTPGAGRRDEIGLVGRAVEGIKAVVAQQAREQAELRRVADEAAAAERKRTMTALADGFEQAVGAIVGSVSTAASELHTTAQTLTTAATQAAVQSSSVAAAAEQASNNVRTVAAAAEQLGASVQEIAGQVAGSSRLARTAADEADDTGSRVQELSQAVSRIGEAVGLISSIAAQTNLLALNATIEAARAGEAGRGFAVVAAEVKDLAAQTARATEEITGHIARVQGSTGDATRALDGIVARIRDINDVATAVAASVEQQGAATQEIVRNVGQAATGTAEVTANIAGVAGAAAQTGTAAQRLLGSASDLSQQSERLNDAVARFLASIRAA